MTDEEFLIRARQMEILDGSTMILALVYPQAGSEGRGGSRHQWIHFFCGCAGGPMCITCVAVLQVFVCMFCMGS